MRIIGVAGPAGAGKDTMADYLVQRYSFIKLSWAAPLKAAMATMGFPEPRNRDDKEKLIPGFPFTWREAAQKLGTEWGRGLDPDIWVKAVGQRMRRSTDRYVLSDCRFENEAAMIRSMGGRMIHLTGRRVALGENAGHASEAGLIVHAGDVVIDNSGPLENAHKIIAAIMAGEYK